MLTTIISMGLGAVSIIAVDKGIDKLRELKKDKELEEFDNETIEKEEIKELKEVYSNFYRSWDSSKGA